jgi:hypothetical protein
MNQEPRVRALAELIDQIPGARVLSACGGHDDPVDNAHVATGNFLINFLLIDHGPVGFRALELIAFGCSQVPKGTARVIAKFAKTSISDNNVLSFDLEGTSHPDDIATRIKPLVAALHGFDPNHKVGTVSRRRNKFPLWRSLAGAGLALACAGAIYIGVQWHQVGRVFDNFAIACAQQPGACTLRQHPLP